MDVNLIFSIYTVFFLTLLSIVFYFSSYGPLKSDDGDTSSSQEDETKPLRSQRARMRANAARQRYEHLLEEVDTSETNEELPKQEKKTSFPTDLKIGAKKAAKLEEKARRKAAREEEEQLREEKKAMELIKEEERKLLLEKEKAEEMLHEEQLKKELEDKQKREHEEYLKMKATFSVEGEGFEEGDEDDKNLLQEFIEHVKKNKVVILEDLAAHFKLKTQDAIDRIATLQNEGTLTGVIDDRGKFIYISLEELENVAKFIKQRGRVSIVDLVESSNELINLAPLTI